jgi:hypothetical protein
LFFFNANIASRISSAASSDVERRLASRKLGAVARKQRPQFAHVIGCIHYSGQDRDGQKKQDRNSGILESIHCFDQKTGCSG